MAKGIATAPITKINQGHPEREQSSRWNIIKAFTQISSTASSKRYSHSAHRASCATEQRSYVRRRKRRHVRIRTTIARQGRAPKIEIVDPNRDQHAFFSAFRSTICNLIFALSLSIASTSCCAGSEAPLPELGKRFFDRTRPRADTSTTTRPRPVQAFPSPRASRFA